MFTLFNFLFTSFCYLNSFWIVSSVQLPSSSSSSASSSWFESQSAEIIDEPEPIRIIGTIPDYLNGILLRVGPSILSSSSKNLTNVYDGLGRLNSWIIDGSTNSAYFQSSMIKSDMYNTSIEAHTLQTTITQQSTTPSTSFTGSFSHDNTNLGLYHFKETSSIYLFNNFQTINEVHLNSLRTIGHVEHNDNLTIPSKEFSLSSSQPKEYIHPTTSEIFLINYILLPNEDNNTSTLYLYAMGSDMIRNIIGYTIIPYLPGHFPLITVIDDYAIITINPIELNLTSLTETTCFTCSLINNLSIYPSDLFVFSLLNIIPKYRTLEELDFYPLTHIQIPSTESFYILQYINGWIENIESDDYPNDEILIIDMCVLTDSDKIQTMFSTEIPGNIRNIEKFPEKDGMKMYCDEIKRLELDIPSRILPRHVYQTITTPFYIEPTDKMISNYNLPIITSQLKLKNIHSITMNPVYSDNYYCFIYGLTSTSSSESSTESFTDTQQQQPNTLLKINICESNKYFEQNLDVTYPKLSTVIGTFSDDSVQLSQPVFVPKPNYEDYNSILPEDSGTLLVMTKSLINGKTKLYLINAGTMLVDAMIESPFELMYDLNGIFIPNDELNEV